jgi:hypothetical protein
VDEIGMEALAEAITVRQRGDKAKRKREVFELITEEAVNSNSRRGVHFKPGPSLSTQKRVLKGLKSNKAYKPGTITVEREREVADPRNMYVEAIMLEAFQSRLPASHVVNSNCSTYDCGMGSRDETVVYIRGTGFTCPITRRTTSIDDGIVLSSNCAVRSDGTTCLPLLG